MRSLLDAGLQPVSNRFPSDPATPEWMHPLTLGQCGGCGLVQCTSPFPADELVPRVDWITYNEPEGHLDSVAALLRSLPGLDSGSVVAGVSFKDDTLIGRLARSGIARTWRLDLRSDLGVQRAGCGAETLQARLTPETAAGIASRHGLADLLLVRHVLEHAHDLRRFTTALTLLVKPGGYLVFEVPDCTTAFARHDYTTLWEEHIAYFTPGTFRATLGRLAGELVYYGCYPYPFENCLLGVVRNGPRATEPMAVDPAELALAQGFGSGLSARTRRLVDFLKRRRQEGTRVALFGAGHLATTFVHLHGLREWIDFVADDNPHKQGLFLPGSRLPIRPSRALIEDGIGLCLLCVNPEAEPKVIQRQPEFVQRGGRFASIFPASPHALEL